MLLVGIGSENQTSEDELDFDISTLDSICEPYYKLNQ